jgi:hypothetical protein
VKNVDSTPDLVLTWTCLGAPIQIEGTVAGHRVYYRDRHDRWRVEVDDQVIAEGMSVIGDEPGFAVARIVEAVWHPYISDAFNAREDARYEEGQ